MTDQVSILIVDDDSFVLKSLRDWFRDEGYSVGVASSGKEALLKLTEKEWDIFLIDIKMPGMDGMELQRRINEARPHSTTIIMTAYASVDTAVEALKRGAYDYVTKPIDPSDLEHLVRNAAERKRLVSENIQLRQKIDEIALTDEIIGKSAAMKEVMEAIQTVSDTDTAVLLRGESGTGKELVAKAIHAHSRRRYMPLVAVNCGALSEGVLESEIFGHEKGAFTGAQYRRKGKFEMADGGTIFLDEIGDISAKTQIDLLRVLEEKKIFRVGGNKEISVDFRLITATNTDLEAAVDSGSFRADLYYRLNVFTIRIPPLRERREDIPLLAGYFLEKFRRSMSKHVESISEEAMARLHAHKWPGNVRELENAIVRAVVVCKSQEILPDHLPFVADSATLLSPDKPLAEVERQHIISVLDQTGWNISQSARLLGIDRVTLYNKLKKYGLKRQ